MGLWYKNISTKVESVPVGNGNVVAARPQDTFEVEVETPVLERLRRQNMVVRTGRPQHAIQGPKPQPVRVELERKPAATEFAQRLAERGRVAGVEDAKRRSAADAMKRATAAEAAKAEAAAVPGAGEAEAVDTEVEATVTVETGATQGKKSKRDKARA